MARAQSTSRSESQRKLWRVPLEVITHSDNSRNPLSAEMQAAGRATRIADPDTDAKTLYELVTGDEADHALFLELIGQYESGEDGIRTLAHQILANGPINPIVLRENRGGETFSIVAGERRFWATWFNFLKGAGRPYIEASVNKDCNSENFYRSISENSCRKAPNLMERAGSIQLAVNGGSTTAEIAEREGCSEQTIKNRLRLLELTAKQQKAVASGNLTMSKALELLRKGGDDVEGDGEAGGNAGATEGAASGVERRRVRKYRDVRQRYDQLVSEFENTSKTDAADKREMEVLAWVLRLDE